MVANPNLLRGDGSLNINPHSFIQVLEGFTEQRRMTICRTQPFLTPLYNEYSPGRTRGAAADSTRSHSKRTPCSRRNPRLSDSPASDAQTRTGRT